MISENLPTACQPRENTRSISNSANAGSVYHELGGVEASSIGTVLSNSRNFFSKLGISASAMSCCPCNVENAALRMRDAVDSETRPCNWERNGSQERNPRVLAMIIEMYVPVALKSRNSQIRVCDGMRLALN